jgi:fructose-bisphosphate aldolase class II
MPVDAAAILAAARAEGVAVGAFNLIPFELAEAIVLGAADARLPVILQLSENTVTYHGSLAPMARASLALADEAPVPVIVHLDHATSVDLVYAALDLGVPSVMFDASVLPYEENVSLTAQVAARCHAAGARIEAELGEVGGKDGVHAPGARTNPDEAAAYVAATGVDALAVAVGTSHAMRTRDAVLDYGLLRELRAAVPVPLVLHGSSGVSDEGLQDAVRAGISKVNIATHLNGVFTGVVRERLAATDSSDPRKYMGPARAATAAEVARLLRLLRLAPLSERPAPAGG